MSEAVSFAYSFHHGTNLHAYNYLGANLIKKDNGYLYSFRVWAARADAVTLVFRNRERLGSYQMKRVTDGGVFECLVESATTLEGCAYRFDVKTGDKTVQKLDPYSRRMLGSADGWSCLYLESRFEFSDGEWLKRRSNLLKSKKGQTLPLPINVYEIHPASFSRRSDGSYLSYRELADALVPYLKYMGYTHVELMPIAEYPYDGSWGYQVSGFFAPSSRFGSPDDLKYLINQLHLNGIGVILDWVCAHFPKDSVGLYEFDGYPLYEYSDPNKMESRGWGTRFFDLRREEVQSFLLSCAMYYIREYHVDALRVDAVASMIYLDYERAVGEWTPNHLGTNINLDGVAFLQKLNSAVHKEFPSVLMIAEESASFGKITHPVSIGGLGFNLKWNMGFSNDLFRYISSDPIYRKYDHKALTFPLMYAFDEKFILPISHDEVVHGKKSFIDKMHGSYEDKFRQARTTLLLIYTYPGKKLTFMGTEFAQFREWDYDSSLEWFMLDFPKHRGFRQYVRSLNYFYLSNKELWELDFSSDGFKWLLVDEADRNSVVYRRVAMGGQDLICAINLSGAEQTLDFTVRSDKLVCLFDTDGPRRTEDVVSVSTAGTDYIASVRLNAFSGIILKEIFSNKKQLKENSNVL